MLLLSAHEELGAADPVSTFWGHIRCALHLNPLVILLLLLAMQPALATPHPPPKKKSNREWVNVGREVKCPQAKPKARLGLSHIVKERSQGQQNWVLGSLR